MGCLLTGHSLQAEHSESTSAKPPDGVTAPSLWIATLTFFTHEPPLREQAEQYKAWKVTRVTPGAGQVCGS